MNEAQQSLVSSSGTRGGKGKLTPLSVTLSYILLLASFLIPTSLYVTFYQVAIIAALTLSLRVKVRNLFKTVSKTFFYFLLIVFLFNSVFYSRENPVFSFWIFTLTEDGVKNGALIVFRITSVVLLTNILFSVLTPYEISNSIAIILSPLKIVGIKVEVIAEVMTMALCYVPLLNKEASSILKAQQARGLDITEGRLFGRVKVITPLIIPLFISSFEKADELSLAMISRGYKGARCIKKERLGFNDVICIFICLSLFIISIFVRIKL